MISTQYEAFRQVAPLLSQPSPSSNWLNVVVVVIVRIEGGGATLFYPLCVCLCVQYSRREEKKKKKLGVGFVWVSRCGRVCLRERRTSFLSFISSAKNSFPTLSTPLCFAEERRGAGHIVGLPTKRKKERKRIWESKAKQGLNDTSQTQPVSSQLLSGVGPRRLLLCLCKLCSYTTRLVD